MRKISYIWVLVAVFIICCVLPLCITIAIQISWSVGYAQESRQTEVVFGTESWWVDENGEYCLQITPAISGFNGVFYISSTKDCFAFTKSINYGLKFVTRIPVLYDTAGCASWKLDEETGVLIITILKMEEEAYEYLNGKVIVLSRLDAPVDTSVFINN